MRRNTSTNFSPLSTTSEQAHIFGWCGGAEGGGLFVVMTLIAQANEICRMEDRTEIQNPLNQQ